MLQPDHDVFVHLLAPHLGAVLRPFTVLYKPTPSPLCRFLPVPELVWNCIEDPDQAPKLLQMGKVAVTGQVLKLIQANFCREGLDEGVQKRVSLTLLKVFIPLPFPHPTHPAAVLSRPLPIYLDENPLCGTLPQMRPATKVLAGCVESGCRLILTF